MVEDLLERLAHQALAGVALVGVVAEVGGLEGAADDLGDREHARDLAVVGAARQQAQEVLAARAAVELVELVRALGRIRPRPVQPVALAGEGEELRAVLAHEHAQLHAGARRRIGREDVGRADDVARAAAKHWPFHARRVSKRTEATGAAIRVRRMTPGAGRGERGPPSTRAPRRGPSSAAWSAGRASCARGCRTPCTGRRAALAHRAGHAWEQARAAGAERTGAARCCARRTSRRWPRATSSW